VKAEQEGTGFVAIPGVQNGTHAIFHGLRCLARYDAAGTLQENTKQAA
jgi:hypothetical protein